MPKTPVQARPETGIADLEARVDRLEARVDTLFDIGAGQMQEVRTKRVVITDDRGLERITLTSSDSDSGTANITVRDSKDDTYVALIAADDDPSYAGVFLFSGGWDAGVFEVEACRGPRCECDQAGVTRHGARGHASVELQAASGEDRRVIIASGDVHGYGPISRTGEAWPRTAATSAVECETCANIGTIINTEDHAWLLGIERRGIEGAAELAWEMDCREDENPGDNLSVEFLLEFIGSHTWENPAAMYRLGRFIKAAVGYRMGREY